ncbi:TonB-dependent receptor domain-containing protein [Candidatus Pseudothioglobus sp. Uisw_086]|uniref:TonB-dependent receptor domain-containing protein n=1 Tax=Candidatus Pseudothioglobus sp. Uisw_086 TaxID=3230998 RepID=UPI003A85109E
MFTKKLIFAASMSAILFTNSANAVIGPIKISLNNEYRTTTPVIGSIATSIKLDKSDIKKTGASTFVELLESIPSITFEGGTGNLAAVRLRGNEASHTLLLIDGQKVTITGGQPNFKMIPLNQISRIEITKGPFSSLYGPGAIGGVINIFTDKDANTFTRTTIDSSYGSNETKQSSINSYFKGETSYVDFTFTDFITDGIDATSGTANGDDDLDPSDRQTYGLNLGTEISENTSINLNMIDSKANIMYDKTYGANNYQNDLRQIGLGITQKFSDRFQTRVDINDQNIMRHGSKYELNTMSVINEFDFDSSKLSVGFMNSVDKDVGNKKQIKHTDVFSQWQGLILDNELSIGVRIIDHDKFSTHSTYNFNWAKDLSATLRINGSYGSATNIANHYKNNLNIVAGKTSLKPEQSKNLEVGLTGDYKWGNVDLKLYKSKVTDAFAYVTASPAYYKNDGAVNIQGAELSIGTELLGWDLNSSVDFNKAITASTNKQKGRRPNRSISLNLSKTSGKWKRNINWKAKSSAWDGDTETNKLGGYGLLNLTTSYDFTEDLTVYLNRNNTLDKDYEMARGYNTLGKTSTLGLTYTF